MTKPGFWKDKIGHRGVLLPWDLKVYTNHDYLETNFMEGLAFTLQCVHLVFTLHRYDIEKPKAFPFRDPEFMKFPIKRMIWSRVEKFWLCLSSSQAAVTETTSGLMLFSCSSNCSLNWMAWSRGVSCFTVDICRKKRGWCENCDWHLCCHNVCVRACTFEGDFIQ